MQGDALLNLTLTSTHKTGIKISRMSEAPDYQKTGQVIVMRHNGLVVIWGKKTEEDSSSFFGSVRSVLQGSASAAFHMFTETARGFEKVNALPRFCYTHHEHSISLLAGDGNYFAASCTRCQVIRMSSVHGGNLLNGVDLKPNFPGAMMCGNVQNMYVVKRHEGVQVLEMDNTASAFTGRIITPLIKPFNAVSFVQVPHKAIAFSSPKQSYMQAISVDENKLLWELHGEVDGAECDPRGMTFSPRHQALLVADGHNSRILALNPANGSHLQTVQLNKTEIGTAIEVILVPQNRLMLVHQSPQQSCVKISYFNIN